MDNSIKQGPAVTEKSVSNVTAREFDPLTEYNSSDQQDRHILDNDATTISTRTVNKIPWLGLLCLIVSFASTLASLAVLIWIHHRRELVPTEGYWKILQPNSILSVFLSINAAALHFALSEGVAISWWLSAQRSNTTVAQLHNVWITGTSTIAALLRWRHASLVSIATIFVATLPINAYLLLGTITTPLGLVESYAQISIPIVRELPAGYSGYFNGGDLDDYYVDTWSNPSNWRSVYQQAKNVANSAYARYAYLGAYDQCGGLQDTQCVDTYLDSTTNEVPAESHLLAEKYYYNSTQSLFAFKAEGTGFAMNCSQSERPYDYWPTVDENRSGPLFMTNLSWEYTSPNSMQLEMVWKSNDSCSGMLNTARCDLQAAVIEYPMEMRLNLAGGYRGPYYSLPINSTWRDDVVRRQLPQYSDENYTNTSHLDLTRYGGIANLMSSWLWANISIETVFNPNGTRPYYYLSIDGPLGNALTPALWFDDDENTGCNLDMRSALSYNSYFQELDKRDAKDWVEMGPYDNPKIGSPVDLVLNQIRQAMFLASIYEGAGWWSYSYANEAYSNGTFVRSGLESDHIQYVQAHLTKTVAVYHIRWYFWAASAALTYVIILVILPTYWNFWSLKRRLTMSPVDVSRAMGAPLQENEEQSRMEVDALLHHVGQKRIQEYLVRQQEGFR